MLVVSDTTKLAERKRRAIGRLILGFQGLAPSVELLDVCGGNVPAGVILFARNIEGKEQTRACNQDLAGLWPKGQLPWISLDQEGGRVRRIKEFPWPAMRVLGQARDQELTRKVIVALNTELRNWGFTGNWAPCADVDSNPDNPVIGDRSFSRDPEEVASQVISTMEAMRSVGILPCIKHFPGHGDTDTDSHLDLPWVRKSIDALEACEWHPFKRAIQAGVDVIMTAHVMFPVLDERYPATMSHRILQGLLRERFGYDGVVVSDDMEMKAVRGRFPVMEQMDVAVKAGVDAFLICSDATLQAECVEALVKLQEREALHEQCAEKSLNRLRQLQIKHQIYQNTMTLTENVTSEDEWMALCEQISERSRISENS